VNREHSLDEKLAALTTAFGGANQLVSVAEVCESIPVRLVVDCVN
jgi:hypothetical protein